MEERKWGAIPLLVIHKSLLPFSLFRVLETCSSSSSSSPSSALLVHSAAGKNFHWWDRSSWHMDAAQWHQNHHQGQGLGLVKLMEEMIMAGNPNPNPNPNPPPAPPFTAEAQRAPGPAAAGTGSTERKARPQKQKAINCPRCNSTNTKFCYYNYSLQQPRYFCKMCRRYWTDGGSLRNVPVGGCSRKNTQSSSSSVMSSADASSSVVASRMVPVGGMVAKKQKPMHEVAHDLNLAFPHHLHHGRVLHPSEFAAFPSRESSSVCNPGGAMVANDAGGGRGMGVFSAEELLRNTGCYVPLPLGLPLEYAAAGFALGEFRMPLPHQQHHQHQQQVQNTGGGDDGDAGGYGAGLQGAQESATGRLLFPLEDLKPGVNAAGGGASAGGDLFEHSKDEGGGGGRETGVLE